MKLLFIYGAPAVGKLTVANEIARTTDFKVFHNHLTIDCVEPIIPRGTASFGKLIKLLRREIVAEAARAGQNLIYTYCYAKGADDAHVAAIVKTVEENGGEICFILLTAEKSEIENRVTAESREKYGKVKCVELLNELFAAYELFAPVPDRKSLIIDNTNLSPQATAREIIEYFHLHNNLPETEI